MKSLCLTHLDVSGLQWIPKAVHIQFVRTQVSRRKSETFALRLAMLVQFLKSLRNSWLRLKQVWRTHPKSLQRVERYHTVRSGKSGNKGNITQWERGVIAQNPGELYGIGLLLLSSLIVPLWSREIAGRFVPMLSSQGEHEAESMHCEVHRGGKIKQEGCEKETVLW